MSTSLYNKTLEVLMATAEVPSRYNKFVAIYAKTEDPELKAHLDAAIKLLHGNEYAKGIVPTSPGNRLNLEHPQWKPLKLFCEQAIASQKPEWQIIAERHGWQRPVVP